jgi:hypothetical protein
MVKLLDNNLFRVLIGIIIIYAIILIRNKLSQKSRMLKYDKRFAYLKTNWKNTIFYKIRLWDYEKTSRISAKKIIFFCEDEYDSTLFAIGYSKRKYERIIGIDCKDILSADYIGKFIDDLLKLFGYDRFTIDVFSFLTKMINKELEVKDNNDKKSIQEQILNLQEKASKHNICLVVLNIDSIKEEYVSTDFKILLEVMPNIIMTSKRLSNIGNIGLYYHYRLSYLDLISASQLINLKMESIFESNNLSICYQEREYIPFFRYEDGHVHCEERGRIIYEINGDLFSDIYEVIQGNTGNFDIISQYILNAECKDDVSLKNRQYIKERIFSYYDSILLLLNPLLMSFIQLLVDLDTSIFDKDLDRFLNRNGIDYYQIKNQLLDIGLINEMRPENYCNFIWEFQIAQKYGDYEDLYFAERDAYLGKRVIMNKLTNVAAAIRSIAYYYRSDVAKGIFLNPLFKKYLFSKKGIFEKYDDFSDDFIISFKEHISSKTNNYRKKLLLLYFERRLYNKHSELTWDEYSKNIKGIEDVVDTKEYISYLLGEKIRINIPYQTIVGNEYLLYFKDEMSIGYNAEKDGMKKIEIL